MADMKPKIAILMGGRSLEREVSIRSGRRVMDALDDKGYPTVSVDAGENLVADLRREKPDVVYIALHGKHGEDGSVQELLEMLNIPYTGSGVLSSIIGIDKVLTKEICRIEEIRTPRFFSLSESVFKDLGASAALPAAVERLGLPMVVKPAAQGSAFGIKFVYQKEELSSALLGALSFDDKVLLEEHIVGTELAVSIIGNDEPKVLPIVEINPKKDWFDFEARYTMGLSEYHVPARLSDEDTERVKDESLRLYQTLGCRGLARVDIILRDHVPYVLEVNTSPGMTETSLTPMAAEAGGLSFPDFCERVVQLALEG